MNSQAQSASHKLVETVSIELGASTTKDQITPVKNKNKKFETPQASQSKKEEVTMANSDFVVAQKSEVSADFQTSTKKP